MSINGRLWTMLYMTQGRRMCIFEVTHKENLECGIHVSYMIQEQGLKVGYNINLSHQWTSTPFLI